MPHSRAPLTAEHRQRISEGRRALFARKRRNAKRAERARRQSARKRAAAERADQRQQARAQQRYETLYEQDKKVKAEYLNDARNLEARRPPLDPAPKARKPLIDEEDIDRWCRKLTLTPTEQRRKHAAKKRL